MKIIKSFDPNGTFAGITIRASDREVRGASIEVLDPAAPDLPAAAIQRACDHSSPPPRRRILNAINALPSSKLSPTQSQPSAAGSRISVDHS